MDPEKRLAEIFGPGGILARAIDAYEHRAQQGKMALAVYQALTSDERLIVEAPTGTGKTLAYLVAAALSRKRTVISTGTKNLQEQLFFKDIPFVRQKLFPGLKVALLKGRNNFVCHTRFLRFMRQPTLRGVGDSLTLDELQKWYKKTRSKGDGDRAELVNLPDDDPTWREISSSSETCLGKRCKHKDDCFIQKMRFKAADRDLVIVNHHLLASDLAVRVSGFGEVIPRYEAVIIDEAHGLEDAATTHLGFHLSQFRITRLTRDVLTGLADAGIDARPYEDALKRVEEGSRWLFRSAAPPGGAGRARLVSLEPGIVEARNELSDHLRAVCDLLAAAPKEAEEVAGLLRRTKAIHDELNIILGENQTGDYACWYESREGTVILHASPVEVGGQLRSQLYEETQSVVFTSATLSSGQDFEYFKARVGLNADPPPVELILDTPFDYARQTLLYVPQSLPEPNSPDFTASIIPLIHEILLRTEGRAFVLFTSHRNMQEVYAGIEGRAPFPILVQGSRPKSRLLEEFRERVGSVLLATASFWEGVDVQGEALSCVIVDRLPFSPPDEPVVSARIERIKKEGGSPFFSLQVPMAIIALKQGLGRLIRTRSDRGVLCILDKRIQTKPYGRLFLKSLHTGPLCRGLEDIEEFFRRSEVTSPPADEQEEHGPKSPARGPSRRRNKPCRK